MELRLVTQPRLVLSLDLDGVLEDGTEGFTATGVAGAAALRLLQMGGVAVLLNTARAMAEVRERVSEFHLLGGAAELGAALWDSTFSRDWSLLSDRGATQLDRLRSALRAEPTVVLDSAHRHSVRASRIIEGVPAPIAGPDARRFLDHNDLTDITFLVAPGHTDFVDRGVDKGIGISRLQQEVGLQALPLAAIGDSACDLPMLKRAAFAFLPAATLPAYLPPRRQRMVRSRYVGDQALWEAACHLVPNIGLKGRVLAALQTLDFPEWFPPALRRPPVRLGLFPRLAATLSSARLPLNSRH
jgi:3-deoxy-D-manno-octulosonate 8-phosphate phosphatase KdsC-like HAD superfamily phosphatase